MKTDETNFVRNVLPAPRQRGTPLLEPTEPVHGEDPTIDELDPFERWRRQREDRGREGGGRGGPAGAYRRAAGGASPTGPHGDLKDAASIHGLNPAALPAPVLSALSEMGEEIAHLNEALTAAAARIDRLEAEIDRDDLTGLLDRGGLLHEIAHVRALDAQERNGPGSTVALIDLEPAPEVRRRCGRPAMERLLRETAEALAEACQPGEALAHLGEGEYAVILPGRAPDEARGRLSEILTAAFKTPFRAEGRDYRLSAAAGLAAAGDGGDADAVLAAADADLRRASGTGRPGS